MFYNVICSEHFFASVLFSDLRREVVCSFVAIGENVDHHFLFKVSFKLDIKFEIMT